MVTHADLIYTYNRMRIEGTQIEDRNLLCEQIRDAVKVNHPVFLENNRLYRYSFFVNIERDIPSDFYTFTGIKPKTMILYGNYCELEILRISYQVNYAYKRMKPIYEYTKKRIQSNCFGRFCETGECFETSIAVLRFISTVFPEETEMINSFIQKIAQEILSGERSVTYQTELYFMITLYEIRSQLAIHYLSLLQIHSFRLKTSISRGKEAFRDHNMQILNLCENIDIQSIRYAL